MPRIPTDTRVPIPHEALRALTGIDLLGRVFPEKLMRVAGRAGGGDQEHKRRLIRELTPGRRAVFMFVAIYAHNIYGWESFLSGLAAEIDRGMLDDMEEGVRHLCDSRLLGIVSRCKKLYCSRESGRRKRAQYAELDKEYECIREESLRNAVEFVKHRPEEFFKPPDNTR